MQFQKSIPLFWIRKQNTAYIDDFSNYVKRLLVVEIKSDHNFAFTTHTRVKF